MKNTQKGMPWNEANKRVVEELRKSKIKHDYESAKKMLFMMFDRVGIEMKDDIETLTKYCFDYMTDYIGTQYHDIVSNYFWCAMDYVAIGGDK